MDLKTPLRTRWLGRLAAGLVLALLIATIPGCGSSKKKDQLSEDNEALYAEARKLIEQRRFVEATTRLGDVGMVAPVGEALDPMVKLALADAFFYQLGTSSAIEAQSRYEQFLNFYPLHPMSSYARFQVGACLLEQASLPSNDQEYSRRARDHFRAMLRELPPDDPWRLAALQAAAKAGDMLAEHDWQVADFYRRRGKPLGEIQRLARLVDEYPASQRREEALYRLGQAYAQVGDSATARLSYERLIADYPAGPWTDKARSELTALAAAPPEPGPAPVPPGGATAPSSGGV
ncbi:MAG: outer membrane protein assembly factor BamD [Acidobacteria bacterium]|nr:outer membrane protein assembly factor BamD [Acidobacteriota bacterium]